MTCEARWWLSVLVACVVALALRLVATGTLVGFGAPPDGRADRDQLDYEATGWELAQGHGFSVDGQPTWFRPPGTSWTIAGVYELAGRRSFAMLRVAFALLSAATCAVVAVAGRRAFGAASGALAAWLLAVDPAHAWYAMHFGSETPYGLAIAGVVTAGLGVMARCRGMGDDHGPGQAPPLHPEGAGVTLGIAILLRPQALLVAPLAVLVALAAPRPWRRRAVVASGVVTAVAALLPLAWMARNEARFGRFALAALGAPTLYGGNNAQVLADPALCGSWVSQRSALGPLVLPRDEALYAERAAAAARRFLRAHWRELPRLEACKLARLVAPRLATPSRALELAFALAWVVVAPLAALGLWSAWRRDPAAAAIIAIPLAALVLTALVFYGAIRFRHSTEPLLVLLAARGLMAARVRRAHAAALDAAPAAP